MNSHNASLPASSEETRAPMKSFAEFGLKPEIEEALRDMGFESPTPVQSQCFECTMSGVDAVIMAQTGTGKTAAFGIPTVQKLDVAQKSVQALVLVPTRELALQVSREISAIGNTLGSKCVPVYGGTSFSNQVREYQSGAHIIVGTPGRVLDHIKRNTMDFGKIRTVVLDEADEMLSMGFEKELREIMEALPEERQTLLFSATIPDDIRRLAGRYMGEFVTVSVSGDAVGASEISHFVYLVSGEGRVGDLIRVLDEEQPKSAIIFCNTREETQFVSNSLCDNGYNARAISSDLSQVEREKVLGKIRENKIQFLVATDVAARGIDISHLSHVINFSFPDSLERYIHRTGRTGRQGKHGAAISLISPHDIGNLYMLRLTYKIFPVEKKLPDVANKALQDELAMLTYFRQSVSGTEVTPRYFNLATRMIHSSDSHYLVAVLLQQLFENGKIQTVVTLSDTEPVKTSPPVVSTGIPDGERSRKSTPPRKEPSLAQQSTVAPSQASEGNRRSSQPAPATKNDQPPVSSEIPSKPAPVAAQPPTRPVAPTPIRQQAPTIPPTPTPGPWGSARKAAVAEKTDAPAMGNTPPSSSGNSGPANVKSDIESRWKSLTSSTPAAAPAAPAAEEKTMADKPEDKAADIKIENKSVDNGKSRPASFGDLTRPEEQILSERVTIVPDFNDTEANTDIYLDAGRSDGMKISALMKEIVEKTGLQRTDIGKVRMLTRSTFINVPNVNCQAVFNVLSAMEVDGRKLKVEYTEET